METKKPFATEADLCAAFIDALKREKGWTAYPEACGWDIVLVRSDGVQIGIEAKLQLNAKVINQALPVYSSWRAGEIGPDFRAVLVPLGCSGGLGTVCDHIGVTVLTLSAPDKWTKLARISPGLPNPFHQWGQGNDWHDWLPVARCKLPEYISDAGAGHPSPLTLSEWKIAAIKLLIILETRPVVRSDFRALNISATRWTAKGGWLDRTPEGYVVGKYTPDLKAQHPTNYNQIKADMPKWMKQVDQVLKRSAAA